MYLRNHIRTSLWILIFVLASMALLSSLPAHAQIETQDEIMEKAVDFYFEKDYDNALKEIERADQRFPDSAHIVGWKAWVFYTQGKWKQALDTYDKAISLDKSYGILYLDRAMVYAQTGKNELAFKDFEKAMKLDAMLAFTPNNLPNNIQPYEFLIRNYSHVLKEQPGDFIAMAFLGNAFANTGNYSKAVRHYEEALKAAPEFASVHTSLNQARQLQQTQRNSKPNCTLPDLGLVQHLENDVQISGEISTDNIGYGWCFTAQVGEIILVEMERTTGNLDSMLYILDSSGEFLMQNDDSFPGNTDSVLVFEVYQPGEYFIITSRHGVNNGTTTGEFDLTFKQVRLFELEGLLESLTDTDQLYSISLALQEVELFELARLGYFTVLAGDLEYAKAYYQLGRLAYYLDGSCGQAFTYWTAYAALEEVDILSFLWSEVGIAALACFAEFLD